MSLAELFYAKHPRRPWFSRFRRSSRKGSGSTSPHPSGDGHAFRLELLEPRLLLSATPTEIVLPENVAVQGAALQLEPAATPAVNLDVDGNGVAEPLTDGRLIFRYLSQFAGPQLIAGNVLGTGATRTTAEAITAFLDQGQANVPNMLDADGNSIAEPLTDGRLIFRYLSQFAGSQLIAGNVLGIGATRTTGDAITAFLDGFLPSQDSAPPIITAGLANDTGVSSTDRITFNPSVSGTVTDQSTIASFRAGFDTTPLVGFVDVLADLQSNGSFTLSPLRISQINGGALTDGGHTLHLQAVDSAGNTTSVFDVTFVLDTQTPGINAVGLSAGSDTGTVGDNITSAAKVVITGSTAAGATLTLGSTSVLATGTGAFQIPDVALVAGANLLSLTSSDLAGNTSQASLTITRQGTVTSDVALDWNQLALDAVRLSVTDPPIATRILAMVSLAQYDTLAAIENTPAYLIHQTVSGPVSVDAALAKAAYTILYQLFPAQRTTFDATLNSLLAGIADGPAKTNALALGQAVGQGVLTVRANDGSDVFVDYPGSQDLGQWRPTAPMFDTADEPQWGDVTPFALTSGEQFRPDAPPALDSAAYAAAVEEIRSLGNATGSSRTAATPRRAIGTSLRSRLRSSRAIVSRPMCVCSLN
jgi:hypothetical protein